MAKKIKKSINKTKKKTYKFFGTDNDFIIIAGGGFLVIFLIMILLR